MAFCLVISHVLPEFPVGNKLVKLFTPFLSSACHKTVNSVFDCFTKSSCGRGDCRNTQRFRLQKFKFRFCFTKRIANFKRRYVYIHSSHIEKVLLARNERKFFDSVAESVEFVCKFKITSNIQFNFGIFFSIIM